VSQCGSVARSLGLVAAGFAAGALVGGGRLARVYDWTTEWTLDAPRAEVFAVLNRPEEQDQWWPSMVVERVKQSGGEPRAVTYRVIQAPSVRRFAPPFRITAEASDIEPERRIRAVVTGDLIGVLDTLLFDRPEGGTRVVFHWYVRVPNPILNALGYVAEPMFRLSHDHVMREGEAGLRAFCERRLSRGLAALSTASSGPVTPSKGANRYAPGEATPYST
jgi:uncharacterized protein YndB with AHSA1/START domain